LKFLTSSGDSVWIGPGLATVVAGPPWVLFARLIKERWFSTKFSIAGLKTAGKGGENVFVDDPFLGGVVGIVVDCDKVIEGFDPVWLRPWRS
jgi:hypothetical protein